MLRVIWTGATSFGLVHASVTLYPASQDVGIDFDWLDKRSMDPVVYKRVNKRTGQEIQGDDIVKGIHQGDGDYVFPSEDQIKAAYPKSTQTIEIEAFVKATEIPLTLLQTPYYLEPLGRGEKVYPLLRESVFKAGVIGIARVVMHTKERLAALTSSGAALVLNALRWGAEIRPLADLKPSAEGKAAAGPKPAELMRAAQLFGDKTGPWKSDDCSDKFSDAIPALMRKKLEAGETATIATLEDAPAQGASNVIELTDLLAKSLTRRKPAGGAEHGSRATVVGAKKAASKASTRRQA